MRQSTFLKYVEFGGSLYPSMDPFSIGTMPGSGPSTFYFRDLDAEGQQQFAISGDRAS